MSVGFKKDLEKATLFACDSRPAERSSRIAGGSAIVMHRPQHNLFTAVLTNAKGWSGYMRFTSVLATLLLDTKADI